jgi:hypothetical protein
MIIKINRRGEGRGERGDERGELVGALVVMKIL